ncbi:hypothetical protein [Denitrificimonas caeni]|uniref:hypothetical protein n=1 Tax=Denitrificimonas caeni TaxID=521720 RepID=UPI0019624D8B|nr:hypothetical protein [Denitrificimonas caeni]
MDINYRNLAREHLSYAKEELDSKKDQRLRHAALELRMAMEALTYDRALAYKDEFPPREYETWQPRKVLLVLLEIDPFADKDSSLAVGVEKEYGKPAPEMKSLGSEVVLSMKVLKKHYDALGSYLHIQSLKHSKTGEGLDFKRFRNRCGDITEFINKVLSSSVFNCTLGRFMSIKCIECGNSIRKRIPVGEKIFEAKCYNCMATYIVTDDGAGNFKQAPHQLKVKCGGTGCHHEIVVWQHELEVGRHWKCPECSGVNAFALGVTYEKASNN